MPGAQARQQVLHGAGGRAGVGVVEQQQPAGIIVKPAQHGVDLHVSFLGLLFRQGQHGKQGGEIACKRFGRAGAGGQQRGVVALAGESVFHRQPGFADAA